MYRRGNNRGSAIVMVVGLLTVLAILGTALLVVTYVDRQQSRAMTARSLADPAAEGAASALMESMRRGLCFLPGGNTPYADANWLLFVDTPANDSNTYWLSRSFCNQFGPPVAWVDTDGDGMADALLFPSGLYNSLGEQYYVAAQVRDTSRWICVNTAGSSNPAVHALPRDGSAVDLVGLLPAYYNSLHASRSPGGNLFAYATKCGLRLLEPDNPAPPLPPSYLPFGIGDEMYLRWLRSPAPTETGRVQTILPPPPALDPNIRRLLTTYSVSQLWARPDPNADPQTSFIQRVAPYVSTDFQKQATYTRVRLMLRRLGLGKGDENAQKRMAAAFVANLMAYMDPVVDPGNGIADGPWAFRPGDANGNAENFTAYGLVQRLVITEAYAAHKCDTVDPAMYAWCCAVEIYNPTNQATVANEYIIADANGGVAFQVPSVPAGDRIVLYNLQKGPSSTVTPMDLGFPGSYPAGWYPAPISFLDRATVRLHRQYPAVAVPADEVAALDDLGYDTSSGTFSSPGDGQVHSWDAKRDDDLARARYNIAAYERSTTNKGHSLKQGKALTGDPIDRDTNPVAYGAPIVRSRAVILTDVGELALPYFASPIRYDDGRTESFPVAMSTAASLGTLIGPTGGQPARARGRLDVAPTSVAYGGYVPGIHPNVPIGCLLSEFFTLNTGDTTRDASPRRVYGRINVNTVLPAEANQILTRLPFPSAIPNLATGSSVWVDANMAAGYILAYRDRGISPDGVRNYASRASAAGIAGLRTNAPSANAGADSASCYLTPDEVAIPLADYANSLMGWTDYLGQPEGPPLPGGVRLAKHRDYLTIRDSIWRPVSNLITVQSDVAVANIYVQLGLKPPPGSLAPLGWYYIVVIDRSNCNTATDFPAVILFSEVK